MLTLGNVECRGYGCGLSLPLDLSGGEIDPAFRTILAHDLKFVTGRYLLTALAGKPPFLD